LAIFKIPNTLEKFALYIFCFQTTTSAPVTTTTAAPALPVLHFQLPRNETTAQFLANMTVVFDIKYIAEWVCHTPYFIMFSLFSQILIYA